MAYRPAPKKKLKASPRELKHIAAIKKKMKKLRKKSEALGVFTPILDARDRNKKK